MPIKTIFFDLGGVLINFSHEKMCENIAQCCQIDNDLVRAHLFKKGLGEQYERGEIDSHTIHKHFCQLSGIALDFAELMEAAASIFSPKKEMPPILENLKKQNISLFLLSNTCDAHFRYVKKHYKFLELFDGYILSYEAASRKPEKTIYETALQISRTPVEECFYTDDVPEYVDAALSYGIDSHLFEHSDGLVRALGDRNIHF